MRWLVKEEPDHYSFDQFAADGFTVWSGVKNPLAQKHLRAMKKGDRVFYYHTGKEKAIVGTATVTSAAYPDPKDKTGRLVVVEEDVKTCGWGAELVSRIVEGDSFYALDRAPARVAGADVPIPYNKNLEAHIRPSPEKVVEAVRSLLDARVGVYS